MVVKKLKDDTKGLGTNYRIKEAPILRVLSPFFFREGLLTYAFAFSITQPSRPRIVVGMGRHDHQRTDIPRKSVSIQ